MPAEGGSVHLKRGPAESYSLMEPYKDATKTEADEDKAMLGPFWVTSQEVPLHHVFGTYLNPAKGSPDRLGISGKVAPDFVGQIMQPFSRKGARQILGRRVESDADTSLDEKASTPAVGRVSEA